MSKIVNGYVFPPPLLFPPPSELGSQMMYPATRYGQDYLSSGPPTFDEHLLQKPNFNGQGQSWSHCPESHFSSKMFRPQFHPRMHVYDLRHNSTWVEKTVAEREAFPNDASHCRRPGRPFKQANDRRNNHFKQNGWNSSNTVVKHFMIPLKLGLMTRDVPRQFRLKEEGEGVFRKEVTKFIF